MGSFIKQIRYVAVVVLCAVVFTLVTNCWNNDQARKWQVDSEDLIWGRIIQMQLGEKDTGFLGRYGASQKNGYLRDCFREGEIPQGEWNSYTHQSGLQGTLFGFVNLIFESFSLGGKIRWAALRFGNSVLYVSAMFLLCGWIWKKQGLLAALTALTCILFAEMSLKAMPNLYWVIWTLILPFLISAVVCDWLGKTRKWSFALLGAVLIGLPTLFRCLCGFEFVSTVMIGAELPVVWKMIEAEKSERIVWFKFAVLIGVFQLLAFAVAVGIWVIQDFLCFQSWSLVKEDILATVSKRTGAFSEWVPDNEAYIESLQVPRLSVLKLYLDQKAYLNVLSVLNLVVIAIISYVPLFIYAVVKKNFSEKVIRQGKWLAFSLISILGPASWYVLASGHSAIHKAINGVLWLFPTIPLLLSVIGGNMAVIILKLRKNRQ